MAEDRCVFIPYVGIGSDVEVGQTLCLPLVHPYVRYNKIEFQDALSPQARTYFYQLDNNEQLMTYWLFDLFLYTINDTVDQIFGQRNAQDKINDALIKSAIDTYNTLGNFIAEVSLSSEEYTDTKVSNFLDYVDDKIAEVFQVTGNLEFLLNGMQEYIDNNITSIYQDTGEAFTAITEYVNENINNLQSSVNTEITNLTNYVDIELDNVYENINIIGSNLYSYIDLQLSNAIIDINNSISNLSTSFNIALADLETKITTDIETGKQYAIEQAKLYSDSLITDLQNTILNPLMEYIDDMDSTIEDIVKTIGDPALLFAWVTNTSIGKWNEIRPLFQIIAIEALRII